MSIKLKVTADDGNVHELTWRKFKAEIDRRLQELGISEDAPIWYIDVSFPTTQEPLIVSFSDELGVSIG